MQTLFPALQSGGTHMSTLTRAILISIGLTLLLNAILWMSGCSVIRM